MSIDFEADIAACLFDEDEFGKAATYTPHGGEAVSCTVIYEERVVIVEGDAGEMAVNAIVITFNRSEVAAPSRDGLVLIGSTSYLLNKMVDDECDEFISAWMVTKQ